MPSPLRVAIILLGESPSPCKFSLLVGQRLHYDVERWKFYLHLDSNTRYVDRPHVTIYSRSFRDTE